MNNQVYYQMRQAEAEERARAICQSRRHWMAARTVEQRMICQPRGTKEVTFPIGNNKIARVLVKKNLSPDDMLRSRKSKQRMIKQGVASINQGLARLLGESQFIGINQRLIKSLLRISFDPSLWIGRQTCAVLRNVFEIIEDNNFSVHAIKLT